MLFDKQDSTFDQGMYQKLSQGELTPLGKLGLRKVSELLMLRTQGDSAPLDPRQRKQSFLWTPCLLSLSVQDLREPQVPCFAAEQRAPSLHAVQMRPLTAPLAKQGAVSGKANQESRGNLFPLAGLKGQSPIKCVT